MVKMLAILASLILISCAKTSEVTAFKGDVGIPGQDGRDGHSLVSQYVEPSELECDEQSGARLDIYIDMDDSLTPTEGDVYSNSIIACNGSNGKDGAIGQTGESGADGKSAYELAVENGFEGSLEEWLESLVGKKGDNGHDGIAGPPGQSGPPGLDGNPGHDGVPGPQGQPGSPGAPGANGHDGNNGQDGKDAHVTPKNVGANCTNITTSFDALIKNQTVEIYTAGYSCSSNKKVFILTDSASTFWLSSTELAVFVSPAGLRILTYN